jgi:hypothetical protein
MGQAQARQDVGLEPTTQNTETSVFCVSMDAAIPLTTVSRSPLPDNHSGCAAPGVAAPPRSSLLRAGWRGFIGVAGGAIAGVLHRLCFLPLLSPALPGASATPTRGASGV